MPYLPSLLLAVLAVVVSGLLALRVSRAARRFAAARKRFRGHLDHGVGLLRARRAALRVAVRERWPGGAHRALLPRTITEQDRAEERRGQ
ncbi:bacteriophage holin [Gandjariella thermophila]|uniref:bacteriophage holin n=1 Tax=Gandjariella thermophila TaxID=1931992 RepID=UPI0010F70C2E|nr:bacteriophage holin [Gandjariella thermophila]